jgi:hypothetical protein
MDDFAMKPFEQRYAPDQIHAAWFKRGSAIAAREGALRLTYRDASLDWLLDDAPRVSIVLDDGECHVLPYEAFVEIIAVGQRAAVAQIDVGPRSDVLAARVGRWLVSLVKLDGVRVRRS